MSSDSTTTRKRHMSEPRKESPEMVNFLTELLAVTALNKHGLLTKADEDRATNAGHKAVTEWKGKQK